VVTYRVAATSNIKVYSVSTMKRKLTQKKFTDRVKIASSSTRIHRKPRYQKAISKEYKVAFQCPTSRNMYLIEAGVRVQCASILPARDDTLTGQLDRGLPSVPYADPETITVLLFSKQKSRLFSGGAAEAVGLERFCRASRTSVAELLDPVFCRYVS
jgi:hypothetical protein